MTRFLPGGRRVLIVDAVLLAWTIAWIVIAVNVSSQVHGLSELSGTVAKSGQAIQASGALVGDLARLPLVGSQIADAAQKVQAAGASAEASGRASRGSIQSLSTLLGFAIALIPTVPLLALYLVVRVSRIREAIEIRRQLSLRWEDPGFQRYLARRALVNLPDRELRRFAPEPWRELETGRYTRLATAELHRLGVARPSRVS